MSRRGFFGFCWAPENVSAASRASGLARRLDDHPAWRRAATSDRLRLWTEADGRLPVAALPAGRGLLLGDAFPMPGVAALPSDLAAALGRARDAAAAARALSRTCWGRYLAILHAPADGATALYRDPTGMLDAVTWRLEDGLDVIASDLALAPPGLAPHRLAINWDRIATFLAVPAAASTPTLFDDVEAVAPGELLTLGGGSRVSKPIWDLAEFAASPPADLTEVQRELVRRVDLGAAALTGASGLALVELSGGLDSAIVAGALGATGAARQVKRWINFVEPRREADESRYARAVAERLGVALHLEALKPTALTEADFAELGRFSRPSIGGADAVRDRAELGQLRAAGAEAIVSGQGGDGVFFQFPSPLVAVDAFRRDGWATLTSPLLAQVARRSRQSVWGVLGQVRAARRGRQRRPTSMSTLLTREVRAFAGSAEHEWVRAGQARGLPPGKLLHLHGAAVTHIYRGPSRRLCEADLVLPLFTQPVLELCLAVAVPDLAGGSYDRPFARSAFAERIPAAVLQRRTKGNLSAYFARLVASSLDSLRPYLLDGCLAEAGLIDRSLLDRTLDPAQLIWGGLAAPADVLIAAAVEAWVRRWQTRVPDSPSAGR